MPYSTSSRFSHSDSPQYTYADVARAVERYLEWKVRHSNDSQIVSWPGDPTKWNECIHPDGYVYYCNPAAQLVMDQRPSEKVQSRAFRRQENHNYEEYVVQRGDDIIESRIYVDHELWYASKSKSRLEEMSRIPGKRPLEDFELRVAYWEYIYQHPTHRNLPANVLEVARKALSCYIMEGLRTGRQTEAPMSLEHSEKLLNFLQHREKAEEKKSTISLKPLPGIPSTKAAKTALVAWVLLNVALHRQLNCYGLETKDGREANHLSRDSTSVGFYAFSCFCFGAPSSHLDHIKSIQRRSRLHGDEHTWPIYVQNLLVEWNTFNLAATVLLSAAVGFLAVPGLDPVTRVATLFSIIFTLGSAVSGVFLVWRHQTGRERLEYNISLFEKSFHSHTLAIILSIPFVCLIWGVITFLVAVTLYTYLGFQVTVEGINIPIDRRTSIMVIVSGGAVVGMLAIIILFFKIFRRNAKRQDKYDA